VSKRTERNGRAIADLHPEIRERAALLISQLEALGMRPCVLHGRRTFAEQARLYAQGRTTPGPIVTKAPPGSSWHNFGLAIDLVDFAASGEKDGYEQSDFDATSYADIEAQAVELGFEWGGHWRTFKDLPHFEYHPGFAANEAKMFQSYSDADGYLPHDFFARRTADA
jgi:peptidoglycan L-alanyl-D-glutamate endopeptidase CwlK